MNPAEIIDRLGVRAVLLRIKPGTKQPSRSGWPNFTFEGTQTPSYQDRLRRAPAIGVLLGKASEGLCSIDFDDEEFKKRFFELNPRLRGSLITTARRGANVWLVIDGEPPPSSKLTFQGRPAGEFRSNGNQTLIAGKHPQGMEYRRIVDAPPVRIRFDEIFWPEGMENPKVVIPPLPSSQSSQCSRSLNPLHTLHNIAQRIQGAKEAKNRLAADPSLDRCYQKFIAKRFSPRQGSRNTDLIKMVSFLHKAVGRSRLFELVGMFYEVNQDLFLDPFETHNREAEAHYEASDRSWRDHLSPKEQEFVGAVPPDHIEAFRICRDLSLLDDEEMQPGRFFISCNDLGDRLGLHPPQASRILEVLGVHQVIEVIERGTRHARGKSGRATRYRWILE